MECTQKLECTQDLYSKQTENKNAEQIGYLGICGTKYPVKRGPNKVGRDSQTCNIVLNLNSISRQHAVINILTKEEFMLMDLDSANKTKLIDKTLQPYIPYALKNGDTIQFGQVFGIFRLLDDDNDLPMTQAIDIPETPVASKFVSRLNNGTVTTIPESPDVSDKEDSFLVASQPRTNTQIKNLNNIFIKPSLGQKKTSNINSKSIRRSDDLHDSPNDSTLSMNSKGNFNQTKDDNIFDMETQIPESHKEKESPDIIYTADTQIPSDVPLIHSLETQVFKTELKESSENEKQSIYNMETQVLDIVPNTPKINLSPNIHSLETQIPSLETHDLASNKCDDNKHSIHNCDTQIPENKPSNKDDGITDKDDSIFDALTQVIPPNTHLESNKNDSAVNNISDNELIEFKDLNAQSFDEDFASQPLLLSEELIEQLDNIKNKYPENNEDKEISDEESKDLPKTSDIHTIATQRIDTKDDDDITDCEDDIFDDCELPNQKTSDIVNESKSISNLPTQIIPVNDDGVDFKDMLTQVVEEDNTVKSDNFGESLTQKIDEADIYNLPTQLIQTDDSLNTKQGAEHNINSPFKVPFSVDKVKKLPKSTDSPLKLMDADCADDNTYYKQTQDLVDDLCTQMSQENNIMETILVSKKSIRINLGSADELVANTGEVEKKLPQHENETSPKQKNNAPLQINHTKDQGKSSKVRNMMKAPSDTSDTEVTPKKLNPFKFMNTDLPNSQEIKSSITLTSKVVASDSSTESESEEHNSDEGTPITFKRKKRGKCHAKQDLTKRFDVKSLPDRIMTRQRKPTIKIQESIKYGEVSKNILKSKLLDDMENIDSEILTANIARLKSAAKHSKHDVNKKAVKVKQESVETTEEEIKMSNENINLKNKVETKKVRVKKEKKEVSDKKETRKNKTINVIVEDKSDNCETTSIVRTRRQKAQSLNEDNITKKSIIIQPVNKKDDSITKKETKKATVSQDSATKTRPKRTTKKEALIEDFTTEQDLEVRRSKRQKNVKEKTEKQSKSEKLKNETVRREQSTVYNLSSESMNDSSRILKRSFTGDIEIQSAKRPRSIASTYSGLRSTPARAGKTQRVLFTAFPCEEVRLKLEKLGAVIVTDVTNCTVLLTLQIKRTFKLLCAVGLGVPIVGLNWVQACADTNMLVDPWLYVMRDEAAEKRFTFSLERTLVGNRNFLKGYNISATPKVLPAAPEMKLIVECSGGAWKEGGSNWVCVSTLADKTLWPTLRKRGATIVTTEFILGGVLKQKVDLQANMYK